MRKTFHVLFVIFTQEWTSMSTTKLYYVYIPCAYCNYFPFMSKQSIEINEIEKHLVPIFVLQLQVTSE
jgi:hypothetical protein